MTSKSAARRPSIATTRPSSTSRPGSGSFGPFIATSPSPGYGEIRSSRRSSRCSRETEAVRPARAHRSPAGRARHRPRPPPARTRPRAARRTPPPAGLPRRRAPPRSTDAGGARCRSRGSSRSARRPARRRAPGCRRAGSVRPRARPPTGGAASRASPGGPPASISPARTASSVISVEPESRRRAHEIGPARAERVVGERVEAHRGQLRVEPGSPTRRKTVKRTALATTAFAVAIVVAGSALRVPARRRSRPHVYSARITGATPPGAQRRLASHRQTDRLQRHQRIARSQWRAR